MGTYFRAVLADVVIGSFDVSLSATNARKKKNYIKLLRIAIKPEDHSWNEI